MFYNVIQCYKMLHNYMYIIYILSLYNYIELLILNMCILYNYIYIYVCG